MGKSLLEQYNSKSHISLIISKQYFWLSIEFWRNAIHHNNNSRNSAVVRKWQCISIAQVLFLCVDITEREVIIAMVTVSNLVAPKRERRSRWHVNAWAHFLHTLQPSLSWAKKPVAVWLFSYQVGRLSEQLRPFFNRHQKFTHTKQRSLRSTNQRRCWRRRSSYHQNGIEVEL